MKALYALFATVMALAMPAGIALAATPSAATPATTVPPVAVYNVNLQPLNNSGASGHATLIQHGNQLTVIMVVTGLQPNEEHVQHIHGFTNGQQAVCPPASSATGQGVVDLPGGGTYGPPYITLADGLPFYGPILLPLTPFQTAPNGVEVYTQTFDLSGANASVLPLGNKAIVVHGIDVNGIYQPTVPVACGQVMAA